MTTRKKQGMKLVGAMMLSLSMASTALAGQWQQEGANWRYYSDNGDRVTGWQQINAAWYYFNADGLMLTGWNQIDGAWYYMRADGSMASDQWIGNYYIGSNGAMAVNTWVGPYYVGGDGAWVQNTGAGNSSSQANSEKTKTEKKTEKESVWLTSLNTIKESWGFWPMKNRDEDVVDSYGNTYLNKYAIKTSGGVFGTYYANGKYNTIKGTIAPDESMNDEIEIEIYADGDLVYSSETVDRMTEPFEFEADITGAKHVKIECVGHEQSIVYGTYCILYKMQFIKE